MLTGGRFLSVLEDAEVGKACKLDVTKARQVEAR
jgi:hypothetical protein